MNLGEFLEKNPTHQANCLTNRGITSLGGLEPYGHLVRFDLSGNKITTLEVEYPTEILQLGVYDNLLTDLRGIENHKRVSNLNIACNPLKSIDGIENLENLASLSISMLDIDYSPLLKLNKLAVFRLHRGTNIRLYLGSEIPIFLSKLVTYSNINML